jgi:hypothetical protein
MAGVPALDHDGLKQDAGGKPRTFFLILPQALALRFCGRSARRARLGAETG